jgi:hypothetical protein
MNRPLDPTFDQRLADWFEDDPSTAPREVLGTVLAAYPSIEQRRRSRLPWRNPLMNRYLLPMAAALIVVIGAVYLVARPVSQVGPPASPSAAPPTAKPTPTSLPSPTPVALGLLDQRFASQRHGYSIATASGWTTTRATKPWAGDHSLDAASGSVDILSTPGLRLYAASAPLGAQTEAEWRDAYVASYGGNGAGLCDVLPDNWPRITIGPVLGFLDGNACAGDGSVVDGDTFFEGVAFTGGRVYLFWLQGAIDRSTFDQLMATVEFSPSSAIDTP